MHTLMMLSQSDSVACVFEGLTAEGMQSVLAGLDS